MTKVIKMDLPGNFKREWYIRDKTLSDGSQVYWVSVWDNLENKRISIHCEDKTQAEELEAHLNKLNAWVSVD